MYAGNWVASEEDKVRWLTDRIPLPLWQMLQKAVTQYLSGWLGNGYSGHLGVDMMLCRVPGTEYLCVHPCVEINLRPYDGTKFPGRILAFFCLGSPLRKLVL